MEGNPTKQNRNPTAGSCQADKLAQEGSMQTCAPQKTSATSSDVLIANHLWFGRAGEMESACGRSCRLYRRFVTKAGEIPCTKFNCGWHVHHTCRSMQNCSLSLPCGAQVRRGGVQWRSEHNPPTCFMQYGSVTRTPNLFDSTNTQICTKELQLLE